MGYAAPLALVLALTATGPEPAAIPESPRIGETADPIPEVALPATGWKGVGQDLAAVGRRVAHPSPRGRLVAAWIASGTVFLYLTRHEIRDWVQDHKSEQRSEIYDAARLLSRGAVAPLAALGLAAAGRWGSDPRRMTAARRLLTACGGAAITTGIGQFVLATERPEDGDEVYFFRANGHGVSADATLAACLVDPLPAGIWPRNESERPRRRRARLALKAFLMTGAVLTAYQRLDADKHWAPDVFLGLANGLTWGRWMAGSRPAVAPLPRRVSFSLSPGGVSMRVRLGRRQVDMDSLANHR